MRRIVAGRVIGGNSISIGGRGGQSGIGITVGGGSACLCTVPVYLVAGYRGIIGGSGPGEIYLGR